MEIKLACVCGQRMLVDSSAGGQHFDCPTCKRSMTVPVFGEAAALPPLEPEGMAPLPETTSIELMCVGNAGKGYINAQIMVLWFEVLINHSDKHVEVIQHYIPIKRYRRELRVNFCEFDIPNGAVCHVTRHIQTRPNIEERKFFNVQNGQFYCLCDGLAFDFPRFFLNELQGYSFRVCDAAPVYQQS